MSSNENQAQCIECGKPMEARRSNAKYCSSTCRSRASREMANSIQDSSTSLPILYTPKARDYEAPAAQDTALFAVSKGIARGSEASASDRTETAYNTHSNDIEALEMQLTMMQEVLEEQKRLPHQLGRLESLQQKLLQRLQQVEQRLERDLGESPQTDRYAAHTSTLHMRVKSLEQSVTQSIDLKNRVARLEAQTAANQRTSFSAQRTDPSALPSSLKLHIQQLLSPLEQEIYRLKENDQAEQILSQLRELARRILSLEQKEKYRIRDDSSTHSGGGWSGTTTVTASRFTTRQATGVEHIQSLEKQLSELRHNHQQLHQYVETMARVVKGIINTLALHGVEMDPSQYSEDATATTVDGFWEDNE